VYIKFPSVPLAYAVHMKKTRKNLKVLRPKKIHYEEHWFDICGALKVIAMLTGLQGGYTNFCNF